MVKIGKYLAYAFFFFLLITLIWYLPSRLTREGKRITYYRLALSEPSSLSSDYEFLRLGCYNIAHGRGSETGASNWRYSTKTELKKHLDEIANQIKKEDLDVVILNEVDFNSAWSLHFNQAKYIGRQAGYRHIVEQRNMDVSLPMARFNFGNSILSRHPVIHTEFVKLPPLSSAEDFFVGNHDSVLAVLQTPMGRLGVLAVHLDYRNEEVRLRCAKYMNKLIEGIAFPIIAAGDFNSSLDGYSEERNRQKGQNTISFLTDHAHFKIFPGIHGNSSFFTYPTAKPRTTIDWIMSRGSVDIVDSKVIQSDLSDHLMVIASFKISSPPTIE